MQLIENIKFPFISGLTKPMTVRNTKLKRETIYWICQFAGWISITLLHFLIISSFQTLQWERIVNGFVFIIAGIGFTHFFRSVIKKRNWLTLPLGKIIPRVFLSSFVLGALIYGTVYGFSLIFDTMTKVNFTAIRPLIGILNSSGIALVWTLIYFSIHYLENYKKTEIESLIWEAAVKDYELKTLKTQLNPHFMFNAMNSIRALIEEDPENAKTALTKLSNILRYSLRMERAEKVPLEIEMETVKDYLALEKIRFEERLNYNFNIDSESARAEIPPMMIQTLVENGIKHGISKRTEGGEISISSKVDNSKLIIEIRNSGHLDEDALKSSKGFGVSNTKHRLNLLFGERASFKLFNENKETVLAKLIIPIGGE